MKRKRMRCLPLAVLLLLARGAAAQEDPGVPGPLPVTPTEYSGTDVSLGAVGPVEFLARVHRPTSLSNGPYPLVLFLHGMHAYCYDVDSEDSVSAWPCLASDGRAQVLSYQGYDYIASTLASYGMIVVSISANAINAFDDQEDLFPHNAERSQLIQKHLDKWVTFNSTGAAPFGTSFVGKVDLQRIGLVGHSRGGQAVLNFAGSTPPIGLRAVLGIAPTGSGMGTPLSSVPLAMLLGYCDGDQHNINGVGYVDQARYAVLTDNTAKYTILGRGANHNYFNSVWGPSSPAGNDDWKDDSDPYCGTSGARLSEPEQQDYARAYIAAFFRKHLLGATQFDSFLNGDALPPPSAQTDDVFVGYLPGSNDRKDLNRLAVQGESTTNSLGGSVTTSSMTATPCGGSLAKCVTSISGGRSTHWGSLPGARLAWSALGGVYSNQLPPFKRDVSNFATLQFRVGLDYTSIDTATNNPVGQPQDFSIRLTDGNGRTSTLRASDYSDVLYYPPGTVGNPSTDNRAIIMNSLRLPVSAFPSADVTNVASVDLVFDQTPKGRIVVSDIAFAEEGISAAEKSQIADGIADF